MYKTSKNESILGGLRMKWGQEEGCVIALPSQKHCIWGGLRVSVEETFIEPVGYILSTTIEKTYSET